MNENLYRFPTSRTDGLIVNELGEDVLVYDQASHTIHQLNLASASVWKLCDGRTSLDTVALNTGLTPDNVRAALAKLDDAGLFEEALAPELRPGTRSRRSFMRQAAVVGTIPIVTSISAPMAARASSTARVQCGLANEFCDVGLVCWGGICMENCLDGRDACGGGQCCGTDYGCSVNGTCVRSGRGGSN